MSLKAFHIFFITVSMMLAVIVAAWAFLNGSPVLGVLSVLAGAALLKYQSKFLEKARQIGLE